MSEGKRIRQNPLEKKPWADTAQGKAPTPPADAAPDNPPAPEPTAAKASDQQAPPVLPADAAPADQAEPPPKRKASYSVSLSEETLEAARNAAYWERETLSGLFERGVLALIEDMAKAAGHESGRFPERTGRIKTGRPPK